VAFLLPVGKPARLLKRAGLDKLSLTGWTNCPNIAAIAALAMEIAMPGNCSQANRAVRISGGSSLRKRPLGKPKIDSRAVMTDAWRRWRHAKRRGWHLTEIDRWTWQRCLKLAWAAARQRRDEIAAYHAKPRNGWAQDIPFPVAA
jgi:hypothetical protein